MLRERAACHPFVTPFNSLASITFLYIQVIAPSISSGASPSRSKRSRNSCAFFDCRDASIPANSQTVVVFSEITSALTSARPITFFSATYVASFSISVLSRVKSAATNSAKSSAPPFSNSTPTSFAIPLATLVAAASLFSTRRLTRHPPGPRRFGHESLDQLFPAGIAKVRLFSQQQNRRNGFPLLQPSQQFYRRHSRHRNFLPAEAGRNLSRPCREPGLANRLSNSQ